MHLPADALRVLIDTTSKAELAAMEGPRPAPSGSAERIAAHIWMLDELLCRALAVLTARQAIRRIEHHDHDDDQRGDEHEGRGGIDRRRG